MTQLDIFSVPVEEVKIERDSDLTPRQWKLYEYLKEQPNYQTQKALINNYELWLSKNGYNNEKYSYGFFQEIQERISNDVQAEFANLSSARNLRKDLKALRTNPLIQKVIVVGKIANSVKEAEDYLERKLAKLSKEWKLYHIEKKKLEKHLQTRLTFASERDFIEAVLENE